MEATHNGKLAKALLEAQVAMPAVEPDKTNPHFGSKFVSLGHLIAKTRPVLNKCGLVITQEPTMDGEGRPTLTTTILHESGEGRSSVMPLFLPKNDPQGQGSALTYAKRYAWASALGISDQEDDDGHGATQAEQPAEPDEVPTPIDTEQVGELLGAINAARGDGMTFDQLALAMGACGIDAPDKRSMQAVAQRVSNLTPEQASALHGEL